VRRQFLRVATANAAAAAVKDRRRDRRATTTGRELANGRESPSWQAKSLNRVPHGSRPAQMVQSLLECVRFCSGKATTRDAQVSPTSRMASPRTASGRSR